MAIQTPGCCDTEWQLLYKILQSLPDISGGGGSSISVFDEGVLLTSGVTSFDFVGAGVTATTIGNAVTVTIPAGAGAVYTFSTGLTNTANTITANISTGVAGGQTAIGGTAAGNSLTLSSTSNATKGNILFGTSRYDEVNNRLGIGLTPLVPLGVQGIIRSDRSTTQFISIDGGDATAMYLTATSSSGATKPFIINTVGSSTTQATKFQFQVASSNKAILDIEGNLLIGDATGSGGITETSAFEIVQTTSPFGVVSNSAGGTGVTGTNTHFLNTFKPGDSVTIGANTVTVSSIATNTSMTTTAIGSAHANQLLVVPGGSRFAFKANGRAGFGLTDPTAYLHIRAGSGAVGNGAIKLDASTLLAVTEAGVIENDGTHVYYTATNGGTRFQLDQQGGGTVTSVSGTANRITSTGGATPVIDISGAYVGQASITTLGTITTGVWNGTLIASTSGGSGVNNAGTLTWGAGGTLGTAAYTNVGAYEVPLTFSTGLTRTVNTITANLSTGIAGGQTVIGGTAASENLTLSSTSNATKGKIIFGTGGASAYDGTLMFLGLGTTSPAALLHLAGNISAAAWTTNGIALRTDAATFTDTTSSGTVTLTAVHALGIPTLVASSATTYTSSATLLINGAPVSSTNVTQTNSFGIRVLAGLASFGGGITTNLNAATSNFGAAGGVASSTTTSATALFGGSATINYRALWNGTTATTAGVGNSVGNAIFGASTITEAASGTHPIIANVVINAPTVTGGAAATTDMTSLYIAGPPTGITPTNPVTSMWVAAGVSKFDGALNYNPTNTAAGTTGNQTINKISGTVNIAAAGTTVTVTNSFCATTSIVFAVVRTNDTTAVLKNVVPGAGSFVINMNAAVTAETSLGFFVINQ